MVRLRLTRITPSDPDHGRVPAEFYDILVGDEAVGTIRLRIGNTPHIVLFGGHVGYLVQERHRGQGYASAALLEPRPVARQHGFEQLWITCRPDNFASRRTLEKAGAVFEEEITVPENTDLFARGDFVMRRYRLRL